MTDTRLTRFELQLRTETYQYRTPMKFGGRVVTDVTVLSCDCNADSAAGHGLGLGSMTMGVAWAWPNVLHGDASARHGDASAVLSDDRKLELVVRLAGKIAEAYQAAEQTGHPMDLCHAMVQTRRDLAAKLAAEEGLAEPIPELAVLLAASPIESALFDAHGKAAGTSSYQLLGPDHLKHDLEHYLGDANYRGLHLSQFIATQPTPSMPLYHLVGALDPLTETDVAEPIGDGLPETLGQWIVRNGLTHLKIKLDGANLDWDVQRVQATYAVANETRPQTDWSFSLDFNERCQDEDYVLRLLNKLAEQSPAALRCVQYIEQPTHRDLDSHPELTMHRAAERRPVVIDESLIGLQSLRTAVEQGYSGIALKACKGHSEALLLGAVARHENLYLCVQDLTCVGASLLHSASLAAHIPGVAAVESNGRQYSPAANQRWMGEFADFFEIREGRIPTAKLNGPGLGYGNDPAGCKSND
ncbi:mandelate racemase/muconate lactonizing enzyme family protein [Stieleria varia]|uniref:Enolase C-terminal domain-containing protein n=1 Tax=Stieleria varia TaxID=2528005 RepID=A0A5C6B2W5_9BACT|nr:mandelate racemase/muconate lactonizing enzyme family protein [Stieleria varia]TWU05832.1 hypothetical protein Pla52n_15470 [Stieleria varia]